MNHSLKVSIRKQRIIFATVSSFPESLKMTYSALATIVMFFILGHSSFVLGRERSPAGPAETCLQGHYHKKAPSAESEIFETCKSWQNHSCCTTETVANINRNKARSLYNFTWQLCGNLSNECLQYMEVKYRPVAKVIERGGGACDKYVGQWTRAYNIQFNAFLFEYVNTRLVGGQ